MGTIFTMAEGAVRRLYQLDRCRRFPNLVRRRFRPLLAGDLDARQSIADWHRNVRVSSVSTRRRRRQFSVRARLQNLWVCRGMDVCDAPESTHSARSLRSHAPEPGSDELPLRQRRDRRQRVRRTDRCIRGAVRAAKNAVRACLSVWHSDFNVIKLLSAPLASIICGAICLAALDPCEATGKQKEWITLDDCQLLPNKSNDGDSFHVRANETEYLVRLYFVDAPETASVGPERLIEQAEYFGVNVPQVIEIGLNAKKFVDAKLSEPFTVVTRLAGGLGRSKVQRIYGFVRTKEGDLGEQLVVNGLARIHGTTAALPGSSTSAEEREKLATLENEAKRRKVGGWRLTGQPLNGTGPLSQSSPVAADSISVMPASSSLAVAITPSQVKNRAKEKTQLGRIDINTATEKELTTVPGIGHVMAARIISARPFRSADDLKRVSGIGDKKYAQIRPYFH